MKDVPALPDVTDVPDRFERGHLWIQELVAGAPLRFRLESTGRVTFADRHRRLDERPPPSLRAAVRHVRERLDRDALLSAREDPSAVNFVGVATRFEGVPYDFERLPPFLGTDVWSGPRERFLPPDVVERSFERVGLAPVNAVAKEVDARYFDPAGYEVPPSAWYDGPAAGVVFRDKRGDRAALRNHDARVDSGSLPDDPATAVAAVVTDERVRRALAALDGDPGFEAVFERVLETVAREEHARLPDVDERAFRSAASEQVRERLS